VLHALAQGRRRLFLADLKAIVVVHEEYLGHEPGAHGIALAERPIDDDSHAVLPAGP
jgi:hypothetical protein